jgi:hypothetical protein
MSISSVIAMKARALLDFADNNAGAITPQKLREFLVDFLDTISPAYGIIRLVTQVLNIGAAPVIIAPFVASLTQSAGYFLNNLAAGTITRTLGGIAGVGQAAGSRTLIVASGEISGPNGREVTVRMFKNGVATDTSATVTTTGAANIESFTISGFDFFLDPPANVTYDLRASSPGAAVNFTFTNLTFVVQAQTVRDFV